METDPFRIRGHVPEFAAIEAGYARASAAARAELRCTLDLAYGSHPDERLDLFFPKAASAPCPVHLFVHGGYWRANRKETYAFLARPIVAVGAIAAIIDYTLMPAARMSVLVGQVRSALTWLAANAAEHGGDPERLTASGHSAGAHLASYLAARARHETALPGCLPSALLLVSGIYDLAPIAASFLQPEIALTPEEIGRWSPLGAEQAPGPRRIVAVGAAETAPFLDQAQAFSRNDTDHRLEVLPALNHMSILAEMGTPESDMANLLTETVLSAKPTSRPRQRP